MTNRRFEEARSSRRRHQDSRTATHWQPEAFAATTAAIPATAFPDSAASEGLPLVLDEMRRLAEGYIRRERGSTTLQPTDQVNETFVRPTRVRLRTWRNAAHFRAFAARVRQRARIGRIRKKRSLIRGRNRQRVALQDPFILGDRSHADPVELRDAIETMRAFDARQACVVELRLHRGLTNTEVATVLGVSLLTVERDWKMGRTWLRRKLAGGDTR